MIKRQIGFFQFRVGQFSNRALCKGRLNCNCSYSKSKIFFRDFCSILIALTSLEIFHLEFPEWLFIKGLWHSQIQVSFETFFATICKSYFGFLFRMNRDLPLDDSIDCIIYEPSTQNKVERWWWELHHRMERFLKNNWRNL